MTIIIVYDWIIPDKVGSMRTKFSSLSGILEKRQFLYTLKVHSISSKGTTRSSQKMNFHLDQSDVIKGRPLQKNVQAEPPEIKTKHTIRSNVFWELFLSATIWNWLGFCKCFGLFTRFDSIIVHNAIGIVLKGKYSSQIWWDSRHTQKLTQK